MTLGAVEPSSLPRQPIVGCRFASFAGVTHGISSRHGGVSPAPLDTLNVSFAVGDEPARVVENRRRLAAALGADLSEMVFAQQVHGPVVGRVGVADRGRGTGIGEPSVPATDALITAEPGVYLALTFADCVPMLFYAPGRRVVGIAHGGWRGTLAGIAAQAVRAMTAEFGVDPGDLRVGIGPSIGPCCYEVGEDVLSIARQTLPQPGRAIVDRLPRRHLDLWESNQQMLVSAGVDRWHVEVAGACTVCHRDRYFSHRGDSGHSGRFAAVIGLEA